MNDSVILPIFAYWLDNALYTKPHAGDPVALATIKQINPFRWQWQTAGSLGYTTTGENARTTVQLRLRFATHEDWMTWCNKHDYTGNSQ